MASPCRYRTIDLDDDTMNTLPAERAKYRRARRSRRDLGSSWLRFTLLPLSAPIDVGHKRLIPLSIFNAL
jgi:hypothetical protein